MPVTVSQSMAYCTDKPARMIVVLCEKTMVFFTFSQPSAITNRCRMMQAATLKDASVIRR